jgi:hypothetical protein
MTKPRILILSHSKRQASVNFQLAMSGIFGVNPSPVMADIMVAAASEKFADEQAVRSFFDTNVKVEADRGPKFETVEDITPKDTDYIYPLFRALSAVIIPGYWVEFPADVLKASVPLLEGQTVYPNHDNEKIEGWLGAVNQSLWDQAGQFSEGVPGINAELKIDWKVNPLIARGLLMTPPAIHSVSVTVVFTYDYSHPELEKERKFWDLLGEEVEGSIVRLVANKIEAYHEISLVTQGADRLAKRGVDIDSDDDEFSATQSNSASTTTAPPPSTIPTPVTTVSAAVDKPKEKPVVKLTAEQKKKLGLEAITGDDVDEGIVLGAVESLSARAEAGDTLLDGARAEALRVATLAEAGTDGTLPAPIATIIAKAGASELPGLTQMYAEKAEAKFKPTCQACGSTNVSGRSSVETPGEETQDYAAPSMPSGRSIFN